MAVAVTVGQTLTCVPGTWTNSPTSYHYQWQRDGTTSIGLNQNTYVAASADVGHTIDCMVYAINAAGSSVAVESNVTASVTSGSGVSWPASYFTGPLGANNVLPTTRPGVMLGLWSVVVGLSASGQRAFMAQRAADMGRWPQIIGMQSTGLDVSGSDLGENWIHSQGAIPYITWDMGTSKDFAGVAAGNYDSAIVSWANRMKTFGHRVMIRFWEEWNLTQSYNSTDFVNGWRHTVNLFHSTGATNCGFVWCSAEQAGNRAKLETAYPGDAYVDWVSTDGYNRDDNTGGSAPCLTGWAEFKDIYDYPANTPACGVNPVSTAREWGPSKPFFSGECACKYDTPGVPSGHTVDPNRKANWHRNIATYAASNMPYLIGVAFFDQDVHSLESGNNWRVDSPCDGVDTGSICDGGATDATTYQGFLDMANTTVFKTGVAGGAS